MRWMITLLFVLTACSSNSLHPVDGGGDAHVEDDECGGGEIVNGTTFYGCAFLVGGCKTTGRSCLCWEKGSMVCQANHQWELIYDSGCPMTPTNGGTLNGLGCLGAKDQCTDGNNHVCDCNHETSTFECVGLE